MNDEQRLRHSRHLLLDEWSEAAQSQLASSHALVIGAGGLGAPALLYLAAAGVGRITVLDPDEVELSNLQRQIAHRTDAIGSPKVQSAAHTIQALNPEVQVQAVQAAADEALLREHLPGVHVVLDCTDTFATRQLINRCSREAGVPLVSAAALRFDGQISVFDPRLPGSPCYACLYPPDSPPEETRCALLGVFGPVVGMMGVMQAGEAIKLLVQAGSASGRPPLQAQADPSWSQHRSLSGRLLMLDGRTWTWTDLRIKRRPACPVCGTH